MSAESDAKLLVAIELLRKQVADLPLAVAMNMRRDPAAEAAGPKLDALGFGRDEGFGGAARRGPDAAPTVGGDVRAAGFGGSGWPAAKLAQAGEAAGKLAGKFAGMLSPLTLATTYLTSATSGFGVLNSAMSLFSSSFGSVVMPVMFTLAAGLTAAGDAVRQKLLPHMDRFSKWVLSTGLPAMEHFASVVGKATDALAYLADSKLGKILGDSDKRGGKVGAIDRMLGGESDVGFDKDATGMAAAVGRTKQAVRGVEDFVKAVVPGGETLTGLGQSFLRATTGEDAYSGTGVRKDGEAEGEGRERRIKAARDTLAELQFQMQPRGSVGDIRGNFARAQQSVLALSPYQQRMLEMQREQISRLERVIAAIERGEEPEAAYPPGGGVDLRRAGGG